MNKKLFAGFTKKQLSLFRKLNNPKKIQDFLNTVRINFRNTYYSPKKVLERGKAQCLEGAMLAAAILRFHGFKPLVVDLKTTGRDEDHDIAVFKQNGHWGALTKTNHATLRFRDPVYKTLRELVMSFFNEYYIEDGSKTLRSYSSPVNLSRFDKINWMTSEKELGLIADYLDSVPHKKILTKKMLANLKRADPIERKVLKLVERKKNKK